MTLYELASLPMFVVGWVIGKIVKFFTWVKDSFIAGYRDGKL